MLPLEGEELKGLGCGKGDMSLEGTMGDKMIANRVFFLFRPPIPTKNNQDLAKRLTEFRKMAHNHFLV